MSVSFLSPAIYTLVYAVIAACFAAARRKRGRLDFLDPGIILAVLLYAYSAASALSVVKNGFTGAGVPIDDDALREYYFACIAGLAGLGFGSLWGGRSNSRLISWSPACLNLTNRCQNRKLVFYALVIGILLAPFYYQSFNPGSATLYADRAYAMRLEGRADSLSGVTYVLTQQGPSLLLIGCATYLVFRAKNVALKGFGLTVLLAYLMTNTLSGWRSTVVQGAIIPLIFYHYRIRRLSFLTLVLLGTSCYVFMGLTAIGRASNTPTEALAAIREQFDLQGSQTLDAEENGELMTATNLMNQISATQSGQLQFSYGYSVLTELAVWIPRALFPNRPLPLSEQYLKVLFPDVLEKGAGYGFFFLQEGYWSFGIVGVFLFMVAYGWTIQVIYRWYQRYLWSDMAALIYSMIFYALVISAVRTGMIGSFRSMLMGILPFLFVALMPDLFNAGEKRSSALGVQGRRNILPLH